MRETSERSSAFSAGVHAPGVSALFLDAAVPQPDPHRTHSADGPFENAALCGRSLGGEFLDDLPTGTFLLQFPFAGAIIVRQRESRQLCHAEPPIDRYCPARMKP